MSVRLKCKILKRSNHVVVWVHVTRKKTEKISFVRFSAPFTSMYDPKSTQKNVILNLEMKLWLIDENFVDGTINLKTTGMDIKLYN